MFIEPHGFNMVIHAMKKQDVVTLCNQYLKIKFDAFTTIKEYKDIYFEKRYKFQNENAKESVYIKFKDQKSPKGRREEGNPATDSMTIINLKGSFFDNSPNFRLSKLLAFLAKYQWTPKQLDVAYVDDEDCLSINKIIYWCKSGYFIGSLFRDRLKLGEDLLKGKFDSIQLGKPTSTINYGTIYVRPDTGHVRIEIKIKNADKIQYLLDSYDDKKRSKFNTRCKKLLVSCIDFITSKTRKTKKPDKYVRQRSWAQFLGSDTKKVSFKEIVERKRNTRETSDQLTFDKKIKRTATMVKNMVERLSTEHKLKDILEKFTDHSGYQLTKQKYFMDWEADDDL